MRKWSYYANEILRPHPGRGEDFSGLKFSQALLQHYGWRSFYVDFTTNYEVACWFATHRYVESRTTEITEDYNEIDLFLFHKNAKYSPLIDDSIGHLYVISIDKAKEIGQEIFDLTILPSDLTLRPIKQCGWLVGPRQYEDSIDPKCIVAHIEAPKKELNKICNFNYADLFPNGDDDFFLRFLELLPWTHIKDDTIENMFERAIEIPDYHFIPQKRYSPEYTFFKEFWISDHIHKFIPPGDVGHDRLHKSLFLRVEETAFFHNELVSLPLKNFKNLLDKNPQIVLESDKLICFPAQFGKYTYTKGFSVFRKGDDIYIEAIELEHPGLTVGGLGTNKGYRYQWDGDFLVRKEHPEDCPCGDDFKHERLVTILAGIDSYLPKAKKLSPNSLLIIPD